MEYVGGQLVYVMAILYTYVVVIWYTFPHFGILYQQKSGNPGLNEQCVRLIDRNSSRLGEEKVRG
jgi:hypothetical protein